MVKNLPASAGNIRDAGSIPGSRRPPGGGHGNPFQRSCLENPMDRAAWQATVHRVTNSQTRSDLAHSTYINWTVLSRSVLSDSVRPHGLSLPVSSVHGDS